jgi:dihydroflavonol-4-reductase
MKVLITGATGFVGSHTVAALKAGGHDVRLFVRSTSRIDPALQPHGLSASDVEQATGDVNDVASVRSALEGCEAVVHAGSAYAYNLPFWKTSNLMKTNVDGTAHVLRTAHEIGLDPIVHVSSIYSIIQKAPTVLTEDAPLSRPPGPYSRSKAASEAIAREMQEAGAPVVITYPGAVWGPQDPHWGETTVLAESILNGVLRAVPDGTMVYTDVREVARVHEAVLKPGLGPRRYIVPSHNLRFFSVIDDIRELTGRDIKVMRIPATPVLWSTWALDWLQKVCPFRFPVSYEATWFLTRDNSVSETRAERDLGIQTRPFVESVRDTLQWMAGTGRLKASLFGKLSSATNS